MLWVMDFGFLKGTSAQWPEYWDPPGSRIRALSTSVQSPKWQLGFLVSFEDFSLPIQGASSWTTPKPSWVDAAHEPGQGLLLTRHHNNPPASLLPSSLPTSFFFLHLHISHCSALQPLPPRNHCNTAHLSPNGLFDQDSIIFIFSYIKPCFL